MISHPLPRAIQGSQLINIVEESMTEMNGEFIKRENAELVSSFTICDRYIGFDYPYNQLTGFSFLFRKSRQATYDAFEKLWKKSPNDLTALLIARDSGEGKTRVRVNEMQVFPLNPVGWLLFPFIKLMSHKSTGFTSPSSFVTFDTIFTLLSAKQSYEHLDLFANASFNFQEPSKGGRAYDKYCEQYQKVEPFYSELIKRIESKLRRAHPYR